MKNVKVRYDQLLFLYAYLRQIDLSVDRSRWTVWTELQLYYKDIVPPSKVAQYLKTSFHLPDLDLGPVTLFPKKKTMKIITNMLLAGVFRRFQLKQDEFMYCYNLLMIFDKVLNSDVKIYNTDMEIVRQGAATYSSWVLEVIISNRDLNKLMSIEHFYQHDRLIAVELNSVIPKDFFKN